jgi:hypothetical protein
VSRCQRGIPRRGIGRHPRPRGGRISSISDPVNVNGGYFSPIPVPVRGKNPRGDTIPAQTPHNGSSYAQMFISLQPQIQMKKTHITIQISPALPSPLTQRAPPSPEPSGKQAMVVDLASVAILNSRSTAPGTHRTSNSRLPAGEHACGVPGPAPASRLHPHPVRHGCLVRLRQAACAHFPCVMGAWPPAPASCAARYLAALCWICRGWISRECEVGERVELRRLRGSG